MHGDGRVPPDDDTLVVFGIHHFGVGDVRDGKEVPGVGRGRTGGVWCHIAPVLGPQCTLSIPKHSQHPDTRVLGDLGPLEAAAGPRGG